MSWRNRDEVCQKNANSLCIWCFRGIFWYFYGKIVFQLPNILGAWISPAPPYATGLETNHSNKHNIITIPTGWRQPLGYLQGWPRKNQGVPRTTPASGRDDRIDIERPKPLGHSASFAVTITQEILSGNLWCMRYLASFISFWRLLPSHLNHSKKSGVDLIPSRLPYVMGDFFSVRSPWLMRDCHSARRNPSKSNEGLQKTLSPPHLNLVLIYIKKN